jgi:hypothetical protein
MYFLSNIQSIEIEQMKKITSMNSGLENLSGLANDGAISKNRWFTDFNSREQIIPAQDPVVKDLSRRE